MKKKYLMLAALATSFYTNTIATEQGETDIYRKLPKPAAQALSFMLDEEFTLANVHGVRPEGQNPENSQKCAKTRISNFLSDHPELHVSQKAIEAAGNHALSMNWKKFYTNYFTKDVVLLDGVEASRRSQAYIKDIVSTLPSHTNPKSYSQNPSMKRAVAKWFVRGACDFLQTRISDEELFVANDPMLTLDSH